MVARYPNLGYTPGKNPWSFFVAKLSQHMRTNCWRENLKSKSPLTDDDGHTTPKKAFKLSSRTKETTVEIPNTDWENHVLEIKKEWSGKRSDQHLQTLLKQTRNGRLSWQSSLKQGQFGPILQRFPCFEEGSFLLHEFFSMRNSQNPDEARCEILTNMELVMKHVASQTKSLEGSDSDKSVKLFQALEDAVGRKKGKGVKSKTCMRVMKYIQNVDRMNEKMLKTDDEEAPKLIFLDSVNNFLCCYVVWDNQRVFGQTKNVLDSVVLLIACFYVFDLEYPEMYSQVLGLIQHWVVHDPYTENKSTNWINSLMNSVEELINN